ncbi:hypothetical protein ACFDTO_31345 [Microbacteriaceae bacterium 4G12]
MATRGSAGHGGSAGSAGSGGAYDPRYDPAFQRGFDGSGRDARGHPTRLPLRPAADSGSETAEQSAGTNPDPGSRSIPGAGDSSWFVGGGSVTAEVDPAPGVPGAGSARGSAAAAGAPAGAVDPEAEERAAATRAHAHRMWTAYTVGLSALSAACMAFGVVLVTRAYGVFNSTSVDSRDDIYWAQLGGQFGPWVFVVGLATGIGVLFLHAARWRPPQE